MACRPSEIESGIDELRTSAKEQVGQELKLGFVLDKVAEQLDIQVTDRRGEHPKSPASPGCTTAASTASAMTSRVMAC